MTALFSTALAGVPEFDELLALSQRDPHAATLASVGLDVDGLVFVCEAREVGDDGFTRARWAVFASQTPLDELEGPIRRQLGRPLERVAGRTSWTGRGGDIWFASTDARYRRPHVDLLDVAHPPAHLTCPDGLPAGTRAIVGVTGTRMRVSFRAASDGPLPEPVPCEALPVLDARVAAPLLDHALADGTWLAARLDGRTGELVVVTPGTWKVRSLPPPPLAHAWSPVAGFGSLALPDGLVVWNGYDPPLIWRDGTWVDAPEFPHSLYGGYSLPLADGRLLAWAGGEAEIVTLPDDRAELPWDAHWRSAIQLADGRVVTSTPVVGATRLDVWSLEEDAPVASLAVCVVNADLVALPRGGIGLLEHWNERTLYEVSLP